MIYAVKRQKESNERLMSRFKKLVQRSRVVQRAKQDAIKRAEKERGEANAIKIAAEGKASAISIEAKAQAQANKVISASLTTKLLQLEQIKVQGKFNEALSVNKDAKIFLTPGGSTPNIWVDTKSAKTQASIH